MKTEEALDRTMNQRLQHLSNYSLVQDYPWTRVCNPWKSQLQQCIVRHSSWTASLQNRLGRCESALEYIIHQHATNDQLSTDLTTAVSTTSNIHPTAPTLLGKDPVVCPFSILSFLVNHEYWSGLILGLLFYSVIMLCWYNLPRLYSIRAGDSLSEAETKPTTSEFIYHKRNYDLGSEPLPMLCLESSLV